MKSTTDGQIQFSLPGEEDSKTKVYAPYRCAASYADGSRLAFNGLTREQARSAMESAAEQHGDISWWDWVTDTNYCGGKYYKLIPPPIHLPVPMIDLTDVPPEDCEKALQDPFEEDGEP